MRPVRIFGLEQSSTQDAPTAEVKTFGQLTAPATPGHPIRSRIFSAKALALAGLASVLVNIPARPAQAQALPPTASSLVSVCSGVSLPRSTVTGIMSPVLTGIYGPIETNVNQTLTSLSAPLLGITGLPAPLSVNVTGLLNTAASGSNISLQVVAADGTLLGATSQCDAAADSYTLDNPAGVAIGGNQITGLGATGQQALAGEIDSIAIGNRAATDAAATGSIAIGTDANVSVAGLQSIALGQNAVATAANAVALGAGSSANRANTVSIGATGSERQLVNVAAGTQATDAVNLGQLNAVAATIPTEAVQYDDSTHAVVTLDGASGTRVTNVTAGAVTSTSTDAVNGLQLFGVQAQVNTNTSNITTLQGQVATNTTDISNLQTQMGNVQTQVSTNTSNISTLQTQVGNVQTQVTTNTADIANLQTQVGGNSSAITNLQTQVSGNTSAITNLQTNVAGNTTAITNLTTAVQNGAIGPVQYSNPATPTTPNGGTPTNSVTLDGGASGAVAVHNVANGVVAAGSTDAVNGGQLFSALSNVPGVVNAVTYDSAAHTSVTLNSGGPATVVHNVANGVAANDAVNMGQMNAGMTTAINAANAYTDSRLSALDFDLSRVRKDARAGTAGALAAAGMPQAAGEGRTMIAGGVGTYRGRVGFAFGASHRAQDGRSVFKLGVTYDSSSHVGANAGAGIEF